MLFLEYPKCSTCQRAGKWLEEHGAVFERRHIVEKNPTKEELKQWHQMSGLPLKRFFNTSGMKYKESRIRYLERMLKTAKIVKDKSAADEAGLNNLVEVYFPEDDETDTFKLVTSIRGNSLDGKISIESPLGKAILKKHVGDRVKVHVNDDYSYEVEIRSIQKTTDDTDDKIRSY